LLLRPDGNGKLSKRDGDRLGFPVFPTDWIAADGEKYTGYRESGYFPEAFVNMLAFLGWNPGTTQELFTLEELAEIFTLERVGKAGAKFDADKTKWFQQQYLRNTADEVIAEQLSQILNNKYDKDALTLVSKLMKERATFVKDILTEGDYLLHRPQHFDAQTVSKKWKQDSSEIMSEWNDRLKSLTDFSASSIEVAFKSFLEVKQLGIGAVLPLFRLLITGAGMGPSMFEIASFLGQEECVERMYEGLAQMKTQAS
jgi:glutamyl-tRNA synthetase